MVHLAGSPRGSRAAILHVDLDAFYAAVEVLVDPTLAGKPLIVGGSGPRGVVASASYEARAYGIHSAMPSARARRLCPHAVFVPGRYRLYADYSRRLHALFRSVTPLVEGIALDEAFLDVSGARRLLGEPEAIAVALRQRIRDELGLWASVGVASTKMVAKLASEAAKPKPSLAGLPGAAGLRGPNAVTAPVPGPNAVTGLPGPNAAAGLRGPSPVAAPAPRPNAVTAPVPGTNAVTAPVPGLGVKVVPEGRELEFLHPLPVRALWGVGPATYRRLERFGVATVGDLAALPVETLVGALGQALGHHLHDLAWGRDPRPVEPNRDAKSIGHEETYPRDHRDPEVLGREVVRLADAVAARLRSSGLAGRTVTLKVRFGDFRTITRSRTLAEAVATGPEVAKAAQALLDRVDPSAGVRLLGVSASNLVERPATQLTFADSAAANRSWEGVGQAVEEVRRRFGEASVGPAALLADSGPERRERGLKLRRIGDQQWGPS